MTQQKIVAAHYQHVDGTSFATNRVALAGDFNCWNRAAHPLTRDGSGLWLAELKAPAAGRYQYKFIVDEKRWTEDPSNGMKVSDGFGGLNSLLVVE